jgi:hypothetical protein
MAKKTKKTNALSKARATKKRMISNKKKWPFYGIFRTKRDTMFIARNPAQLARAKRLKWSKLK